MSSWQHPISNDLKISDVPKLSNLHVTPLHSVTTKLQLAAGNPQEHSITTHPSRRYNQKHTQWDGSDIFFDGTQNST